MRLQLLFVILFASTAASSQIVITIPTKLPDSILYNVTNYVQAATQQPASNEVHTVVYNNITNPLYQMHKLYMDSARTILLSQIFYHQGKFNGPYTSYQMNNILARGRFKEGKPDAERITYYGNGTTIMEKANYTEGKRSLEKENFLLIGVDLRVVVLCCKSGRIVFSMGLPSYFKGFENTDDFAFTIFSELNDYRIAKHHLNVSKIISH